MIKTTNKPFGGYSLTNLKEAGQVSTAFEAILTKNGEQLAHVSNRGNGGCHNYFPVGHSGRAAFDAAMAEFEAFATEWLGGDAGFEDGDALADHLIEVATLNRMRSTPFLIDDEDYFTTGRFRRIPGASYEQTVETLRAMRDTGRNPRVWDKKQCAFVPIS